MIDGGVIAAYLAAAVARGGGRLLDRVVDGALDRLTDSVARRLGPRPAADLARSPNDSASLAEVTRAIDTVARRDAGFVRELTALRQQLDSHGGRQNAAGASGTPSTSSSGRAVAAVGGPSRCG